MTEHTKTPPPEAFVPYEGAPVFYISEAQLAERWGIKEQTIRLWRVRGRGPRYYKLMGGGRPIIRYDIDDICAYEQLVGTLEQPDESVAAWLALSDLDRVFDSSITDNPIARTRKKT